MASTPKTPKIGSPRLKPPRPTAASAARAARNAATNRNLSLNQSTSLRHSPTRILSSPAPSKVKTVPQRKTEPIIAEIQKITNPENELLVTEYKEPFSQVDSYVLLENISAAKTDDGAEPNVNGSQPEETTDNDVVESPRSCPRTPTPSSRPQTPKSMPSSRPQTPKTISRPSSRPTTPHQLSRPTTPHQPSRPTTPAHPAQRHGTPASRPNTPHSPTKPTTPASPQISGIQDDDIKNTFMLKQQQFQVMKKELDLKQQAVLELFETLQTLREHMSGDGLDCGEGPQELVMFNVADWTAEEVTQLCRDAAASSAEGAVAIINSTVSIDACALKELDDRLERVPRSFAEICLQAFSARQELIDWIKGLIEKNIIKEENGDGECLERIARYNKQGFELCEALRETKGQADDVVGTFTQLSRQAYRERGALIAVGESLVREIARLRQDIEAQSAAINEMQQVHAQIDAAKALEQSQRESQQVKAVSSNHKEKLAATEQQLRLARMRINKMDRQLREADTSIASLTGTVKTLEDQSRQKEVQMEARARKLKESLKTGEVATGHLAQQRDALQSQIVNLKEEMEKLASQHQSEIQELTNKFNEAKSDYEDQRNATEMERENKEFAQAALSNSQKVIEELNSKVVESDTSKTNPDILTEREMDLWADLQATKDTLRMTEDEVTACKREKVRFLESLTKIAETESKVGMQQKLAAELLSKEEILGKMQIQIRELTKNIKLNEQKLTQYEQYVRDLQSHNRAIANCQESPDGISYQDLQQEIMTLKMNNLEAVHRNDELSERLMNKEQQLEMQDKTSRAQVREELINMLKNKETEQSRELTALQQDLEHRMKIVDEVNKQIAAKAEEIQELFSTLENKQQQIHRLEKIVLALEEQQRRAQAQRTRHEEKIAALEHELAAGGNRRERKFLFF